MVPPCAKQGWRQDLPTNSANYVGLPSAISRAPRLGTDRGTVAAACDLWKTVLPARLDSFEGVFQFHDLSPLTPEQNLCRNCYTFEIDLDPLKDLTVSPGPVLSQGWLELKVA